jgi:hypothetical protein
VLPDARTERETIQNLCRQINAVIDASGATPGCRTLAAIITAARYASRAAMPASVAGAMLADYVSRGDPV